MSTRYRVISTKRLDALVDEVNNQLNTGWTISGSIAVRYDPTDGSSTFFQPMVREEGLVPNGKHFKEPA